MTKIKEGGKNGVIMCDLERIGNKWNIRSRNYFTKNTVVSNDVIPILAKLLKGDSSDVRIL